MRIKKQVKKRKNFEPPLRNLNVVDTPKLFNHGNVIDVRTSKLNFGLCFGKEFAPGDAGCLNSDHMQYLQKHIPTIAGYVWQKSNTVKQSSGDFHRHLFCHQGLLDHVEPAR